MEDREALLMVARIMAIWPTPELPHSTQNHWAKALLDYDVLTVKTAIDRVAKTPLGRPVQLADITSAADAEWAETFALQADQRTREQRQAELEDVTPASPEETRSILAGFFERFGHGSRSVRLARARDAGDVQGKVEAGRELARRQIAAAEHPLPDGGLTPRRPGPGVEVLATACGAAPGTEGVKIDGVWCCPNCRSPIREGCVRPRAEA